MMMTRQWLATIRNAPVAQRTCPAGHPVSGGRALHCPTCGRLVPRRFSRVCPNGHVISGPHTVCPYCGEIPSPGRTFRVVALVALGLFVVLMMAVFIADVPQRLIDTSLEMIESAREFVLNLPEMLDVPLFETPGPDA